MGFVSFSDSHSDPDVAVNGCSSEIRTRRKHLLSIYTGRWRGVEEQPVGGLARVGPLFPDTLYKDFCPYGFKWSPTGRIHERDIVLPESSLAFVLPRRGRAKRKVSTRVCGQAETTLKPLAVN